MKQATLITSLALIFLTACTVVFVIFQPFIWAYFLNSPPPESSNFLGDVMGLNVTLMAFALTGFGAAAYHFIKDRLENELMAKLQDKQNELSSTLQNEIDENRRQFLAEAHLQRSKQYWEEYDQVMWYKRYKYSQQCENDKTFKTIVNLAIREAERAHEYAKLLPQIPEYQLLTFGIFTYLAYHLATRRDEGDRERALTMASGLECSKNGDVVEYSDPGESSSDALDTIAWVRLRFAEDLQNAVQTNRKILEDILANKTLALEDEEQYKSKYEKLFGIKLDDPNDFAT